MGRARGQQNAVIAADMSPERSDRFASVLGARRGPGDDLSIARGSMQSGDSVPALRAVDNGADTTGSLAVELARHLAQDFSVDAEQTISERLGRVFALRQNIDDEHLPVLADEFREQAQSSIHTVLSVGARARRGTDTLHSECQSTVIALAEEHAADYLRAGGAKHLQRVLGRRSYSEARHYVCSRTDLHPRSGALAPLLVAAINAEFVRELCHDQTLRPSIPEEALADSACNLHRGDPPR